MKNVNIRNILQWTGGTVVAGSSEVTVSGVSTDTRTLHEGSCFIPLTGERFDGHHFIVDALRRGSTAVLCRRDHVASVLNDHPWPADCATLVAVDDTLKALQQFARGYRGTFDLPLVGVTGSNGKTTTKECLRSVLASAGTVAATEGNLNNHIGVPLTLFQLDTDTDWAVVEMGMNAPGEIASLADIARPSVGVVTNVGPSHLGGFTGIDDIADAKAELVRALPADGVAILNADDARVEAMRDQTSAKVITYGLSTHADVRADKVELRGVDGSRFQIVYGALRFPVTVKLAGGHQVHNALATAAAAFALGLDHGHVQEGLLSLRSVPMRMHVKRLKGDVTLIDDAYNASPLSMFAAIDTLACTPARRRIALFAGMLELGEQSEALHRSVGESVAEAGIDRLFAVGSEGQWIAEGARRKGMPDACIQVLTDVTEAGALLADSLQSGDSVLVKGSRGFQLETVVRTIEARGGMDVAAGAEENA